MGKVTDINKFKRKLNEQLEDMPDPKTEGDYLIVVLGEDKEGLPLVCIEQCEVEGSHEHKERILINGDMMDSLIEELITVSEIIDSGGKLH
jgi:hypothetical protein|tara:strand:- start:531 stop:803 length:273 start_codon:yes stop_codon:yes gene_type:complete